MPLNKETKLNHPLRTWRLSQVSLVDDLFFASSSWISWLFSLNQSLFFLMVNPRTSSDVCRMALFSGSQSISGEVSSEQSLFSSLDFRPAWNSAFTSADWSLFRLNFFFGGGPLFLGLGLKCNLSLQCTKQ